MASVKQPKIEMWAIGRLIPYELNAKIHTEGQIESLSKVIKTQGWDVPIVVDKEGVIIKGHGRRLAAIHMGLHEVPVICRTDLTPAQVKAARLSDNRVALGDFDTELLKADMDGLKLDGYDMSEMGFDQRELDMLLNEMDTIDASVFSGSESPSEPRDGDGSSESEEAAPAAAEKVLDLIKVLGFKTLPASAERAVLKFQSYAEVKTGLKGEHAFARFCDDVVAEIEAA